MTDNSETEQDERIIVHVDADLEALLPGFLKDWGEEVRAMRDALEENNYEIIRKNLDTLSGYLERLEIVYE